MNETFNTPGHLPDMMEKTYLVALDHQHACIYAIAANQGHAVSCVESDILSTAASDHESMRSTHGAGHGQHTSGGEKHEKEHYAHTFVKHFAETIYKAHNEGAFKNLIIFAPKDMKHKVKEALHKSFADNTEILEGNVMKDHPNDLLERYWKAHKPQ